MSSSADSAARPLPRLARVWDGEVEPLDRDRLARTTRISCFWRCPENAAADLAPPLVATGVRVIDLSGAFRIRDDAARSRWYPATKALPAGAAYGLTEHYKCRRARRRARRQPRLLSDGGAAGAAAAWTSRAARHGRRRHHRREVRHLRRGPRAERSHALLREPRLGLGVRRLRSSARRGDGTGARRVGDVRAAPGAARSRHPRDDLREGASGVTTPSRSPTSSTRRTRTSRSCGSRATRCRRSSTSRGRTSATSAGGSSRHRGGWCIVACLDNLVKGAAGQALQNFNVACGFDERTALL